MCLKMLKETHVDTGFMHESFHKVDPFDFNRSWFAWANTLFGEFIIKVYHERPWVLKNKFVLESSIFSVSTTFHTFQLRQRLFRRLHK
jgi:hypothetical protein